MKVFVGMENSGIVRDHFIRHGHDAISCDLLPSDRPGPHIIGNVFDYINDGWDLGIFHPDCTYLCSSGLHWNHKRDGRAEKTVAALNDVRRIMGANIKHIAIENPSGCIGTEIKSADQFIQPYCFGHDASKNTGLWLKNLPPLKCTKYIKPRLVMFEGKTVERWSNQTDSGQNKLPPSADRWKLRAETYHGVADAMAIQWGGNHSEYQIYLF